MNPDLKKAVLALDSYNRYYSKGMDVSSNKIGNYSFINVPLPDLAEEHVRIGDSFGDGIVDVACREDRDAVIGDPHGVECRIDRSPWQTNYPSIGGLPAAG